MTDKRVFGDANEVVSTSGKDSEEVVDGLLD